MVQLRHNCVSCNSAHLWPRMPLRGMRNQRESPHLCRKLLTINQTRIIAEKAKIRIIALSNKLKRNLHVFRRQACHMELAVKVHCTFLFIQHLYL